MNSKKPLLSIVIPALNEEKYIGLLLKSIADQDFDNYEIIIADAGSKDKTIEIAKKYNAKIISGGIPSIARNKGIKEANGKFILFVDSDVILGKNILKDIVQILNEKPGVGTCLFKPLSKNAFDNLFAKLLNFLIRLARTTTYANISGPLIFTTTELAKEVGGFQENIRAGEDTHFVRKIKKLSRMSIIKKYSYVSVRRYDHQSRFKYIAHLTAYNIKSLFGKYNASYDYIDDLNKQ